MSGLRDLLAPSVGPKPRVGWNTPLVVRLAGRINYQGEDVCWLWRGRLSSGYGRITVEGRPVFVHRIVYELLVGPIPAGTELDHLCRVTACCNPRHLEAVPHRINVLRGIGPFARRAAQTHCIHGHPFDEANTAIRTTGFRHCRACDRRQHAEAKAKKNQAAR